MTADRKAAMERADFVVRTQVMRDKESVNLTAAFREVTAELEQARKAREEADKSANRWFHECMMIAHKTDSAEQRAAELQTRLDRMEAASLSAAALLQRWADQIKDCHTTEAGEWTDEEEAEADYNELIKAIRALSAQPKAAGQESTPT